MKQTYQASFVELVLILTSVDGYLTSDVGRVFSLGLLPGKLLGLFVCEAADLEVAPCLVDSVVNQAEHADEQEHGEVHGWEVSQVQQTAELVVEQKCLRIGDKGMAGDVERDAQQDGADDTDADLEGRDQYLHIRNNDDASESEVTSIDVATVPSVNARTLPSNRQQSEDQNQETLPKAVEDPSQEDPRVEVQITHAVLVERGIAEQLLFRVFEVHSGEPDDRHRGKHRIKHVVKKQVVEHRA